MIQDSFFSSSSPMLRGETNGTIGPQLQGSSEDDNDEPTNADVFSSAGQGVIPMGAPGIYAPINQFSLSSTGSDSTFINTTDTTFPFQLPVVRDVFSHLPEAPPADWWKDERYAETYSEDPFSLNKPVDRYVDLKTAITHWSKEQMPLRVYISLSVSRARDGRAKQIIKQCLDEWVQASDHLVTYEMTEDFKNADVYFWQHSTADNFWAQTLQDFHKGRVETAKVLILERTLQYLPERRFRAVCLHQIGHALGLDDVTADNSVMSQYCSDATHPINQISEFDKRYLHGVYTTKQAQLPAASPPLVTATASP
jgi:hypothetical protein